MKQKKKQKKFVELMDYGEMKQKERDKQIDVSEKTICVQKKNTEFMAEYESLLRNKMRSLAATAFQTETKLLKARSEMVRLMAAKDILDRAGFKPEDNVNLNADLDLNITIDYGDGDVDGSEHTS